jgi:hypothetical protein
MQYNKRMISIKHTTPSINKCTRPLEISLSIIRRQKGTHNNGMVLRSIFKNEASLVRGPEKASKTEACKDSKARQNTVSRISCISLIWQFFRDLKNYLIKVG